MSENRISSFLSWEAKSRDTIDVKRCYIKLAGDLVAGVLLSQIIYWFLPKKDGGDKLTIEQDGRLWIAKKRDEWEEECCISPKQFDRAIEILEGVGVVTTAIYRFNGSPTKHVSLNFEELIDSLDTLENPTSPKGKIQLPQRVISSIKNKTTAENSSAEAESKSKHCLFREEFNAYYQRANGIPAPWNAPEATNLKRWIESNPTISLEQWRSIITHRERSPVAHGEPLSLWIKRAAVWLNGETDAWGKPPNGGFNGKDKIAHNINLLERHLQRTEDKDCDSGNGLFSGSDIDGSIPDPFSEEAIE